MIVPNVIKKVSVPKKYKKIDFVEDCAFGCGFKTSKDTLDFAGYFALDNTLQFFPATPVQTYYVLGQILCFSDNGEVYKPNGKTWSMLGDTYDSKPFIKDCKILGEDRIIIASSKKGRIMDGKAVTFNHPVSFTSYIYDNRLITADGNKVYYSENLDVLAQKDQLDFGLLFEAPTHIGIVQAMRYIGTTIYVVGEHGVCCLQDCFTGNDFSCKILNLPYLDVLAGSVQAVGEAIYLISQSKLYKITQNSVKSFVVTEDENRTFKSSSGVVDNKYVCATFKQGDYFDVALIFNTEDQTFHYNYCMQGISEQGGYCIDQMARMFYKYQSNLNANGDVVYWRSKRLDMGTSKRKKITGLRLSVALDVTLTIKGGFGTKSVVLQNHQRYVRCNLLSDWFKLEIQSSNNSLPISCLEIEYTEMGV